MIAHDAYLKKIAIPDAWLVKILDCLKKIERSNVYHWPYYMVPWSMCSFAAHGWLMHVVRSSICLIKIEYWSVWSVVRRLEIVVLWRLWLSEVSSSKGIWLIEAYCWIKHVVGWRICLSNQMKSKVRVVGWNMCLVKKLVCLKKVKVWNTWLV